MYVCVLALLIKGQILSIGMGKIYSPIFLPQGFTFDHCRRQRFNLQYHRVDVPGHSRRASV